MSALQEIVAGIHSWSWFSERFGYHFNGFLVESDEGNLAVDPVEMGDEVLAELAALGVARILLTNRNHFRDARKLHERTKAPVLVHAADADFVRGKGVPVAGALVPDDGVGPFTIFHCPGKSPGEVVLSWPERRLVIVGDACVGRAPGVLGLLPAAVIDDPAELRRSLARLAEEVDFDTLLAADGHHVMGGARAALHALLSEPAAG